MPQYQITLHPTAKDKLTSLDSRDRERITDTLQEVAQSRKPTAHGKCELLDSHDSKKAYKVRVGDWRAIATLEKPEFRVLQLGRRERVYRNADDVYASM